jgi:hypothetical protein
MGAKDDVQARNSSSQALRLGGALSMAALSNERTAGAPYDSERQDQCPVSDTIDLNQRGLAVFVAGFE